MTLDELQKVRIITSAAPDTQLLSTLTKHRKVEHKKTSKVVPAKFIDYGVFSSFAPNFDGADASLSMQETSLCMKRKLQLVHELVDPSEPIAELEAIEEPQETLETFLERHKEIDHSDEYCESFLATLKEQGIDIEALLHAESNESLIAQNNTHIQSLIDHQSERFLLSSISTPTPSEYNTTAFLTSNLLTLIAQLPPSSVTPESLVKASYNKLQMYDTPVSGSLHFQFVQGISTNYIPSSNTVAKLPERYSMQSAQQAGLARTQSMDTSRHTPSMSMGSMYGQAKPMAQMTPGKMSGYQGQQGSVQMQMTQQDAYSTRRATGNLKTPGQYA